MAKSESSVMAIRELLRQKATEIPERYTLTSIYQIFFKTGSVQDISRPERPTSITEDTINAAEQSFSQQLPGLIFSGFIGTF